MEKTKITDIDIPFFRLVSFMVKVSIAAIPAGLLVFFIWTVVIGFVLGLAGMR